MAFLDSGCAWGSWRRLQMVFTQESGAHGIGARKLGTYLVIAVVYTLCGGRWSLDTHTSAAHCTPFPVPCRQSVLYDTD
jgi:hypothetical protein